MSRVFTNGLGDRGSIPGRVIPKTQKIVLDAALLSTKVTIKSKVEQSRKWRCALLFISGHPRRLLHYSSYNFLFLFLLSFLFSSSMFFSLLSHLFPHTLFLFTHVSNFLKFFCLFHYTFYSFPFTSAFSFFSSSIFSFSFF